jgi:hypothetical protein
MAQASPANSAHPPCAPPRPFQQRPRPCAGAQRSRPCALSLPLSLFFAPFHQSLRPSAGAQRRYPTGAHDAPQRAAPARGVIDADPHDPEEVRCLGLCPHSADTAGRPGRSLFRRPSPHLITGLAGGAGVRRRRMLPSAAMSLRHFARPVHFITAETGFRAVSWHGIDDFRTPSRPRRPPTGTRDMIRIPERL